MNSLTPSTFGLISSDMISPAVDPVPPTKLVIVALVKLSVTAVFPVEPVSPCVKVNTPARLSCTSIVPLWPATASIHALREVAALANSPPVKLVAVVLASVSVTVVLPSEPLVACTQVKTPALSSVTVIFPLCPHTFSIANLS